MAPSVKPKFKSSPARTAPAPAVKPSTIAEPSALEPAEVRHPKSVVSNQEFLKISRAHEAQLSEVKRLHLLRLAGIAPAPAREPGKVLFPNRAVGTNIVDPVYSKHPLCDKLSNKDVARVRNIVNMAEIDDTKYVMHYADDLRVRFGTLIDGLVKEQTSGNTSKINDGIAELLQVLEDSKQMMDLLRNPPEEPSLWTRMVFKNTAVPSLHTVFTAFHEHLRSVNRIVKELVSNSANLISMIDSFDEVFKNNQDNFDLLNIHIIAGRIIAEKHYSVTIPEREKVLDPSDIFEVQNFAYFKDCVQRFERKVDELQKIAHSVILNAPMIRMLQIGSKDKADRIQQIAQIVAPLWTQQCAVIFNALQSIDATSLANAVKDKRFTAKRTVLADMEQSYHSLKSILA